MQTHSATGALVTGIHAGHGQPANDVGLVFHITIRQLDETLIGETGKFVDSCEAKNWGEERGGLGSKVTVRPDIETSRLHGKVRYPHRLHPLATEEAKDGWAEAADRAYAADKASGAVEARRLARAVELDERSPAGVARAQGAFA